MKICEYKNRLVFYTSVLLFQLNDMSGACPFRTGGRGLWVGSFSVGSAGSTCTLFQIELIVDQLNQGIVVNLDITCGLRVQ